MLVYAGKVSRPRAKALAVDRLPDLLLLVALFAVVALTAVFVVWLVGSVHEREECGGVSASICRGLRESDERECRSGEGCGTPLPGRKP
jgi:hypothetical protein